LEAALVGVFLGHLQQICGRLAARAAADTGPVAL
jgi:hypothetical protein